MKHLSKSVYLSVFLTILITLLTFLAYFLPNIAIAENLSVTCQHSGEACVTPSCPEGYFPERNCNFTTGDCGPSLATIKCLAGTPPNSTPSTQPAQCRSVNQPCDTQNPCCDGLSCTGRFCKAPISTPAPTCGAKGQPCCSNNACNSGLECMGRFCKISDSVPQQPKSTEPVPGLLFPCSETSDNEFHSLRPYQASPCGGAPQALFCSNKLVIFENFQFKSHPTCRKLRRKQTGDFDCPVNYHVKAHDLNITLDESELPILGNTQDEFDDATKLNEYASWYLNGVIDKRENENATNDQVVNFSGPVKKLLPEMVQDAQRIETIRSPKTITLTEEITLSLLEEDDDLSDKVDNHDQLVIDDKRLSFWADGSLSGVRSVTNTLNNLPNTIIGGLLGGIATQGLNSAGISTRLEDAWNKCFPPLPWDDGTVEVPTEKNPSIPFENDLSYKKAYNEWLGKSCVVLPVVGLVCVDLGLGPIDVISNECSDLWHYVPLSNNSDKKGKNYLLTGDGPNYVPSQGTEIDNAQHKKFRNAPLYFAHTQEVADLSELLNKTYQPANYESEKLPETTEQIKKGTKPVEKLPTTLSPDKQYPVNLDPYANLDCSAVNVRVNEGDDLFPGDRPDNKELYVEQAEYDITNVVCHEIYEWEPAGCNPRLDPDCHLTEDLDCPGQVGIEFKTGTQTPYANEIFSETVADSGSTFRKIFPKVEKGAPVECIADIPTQTGVTYSIENSIHEAPISQYGGTQDFVQKAYPADGASDGTMLTFPHIGSVYEYFLKGIQTALRPKGYGEPIANGNCKPIEPVECGLWEEKLEKSSGGDCGICTSELGDLAKRILATAGKAYNVPAANIWAAMLHEGGDWAEFKGQYSDENVRKWSTPEQCGGDPMPLCDNSDQKTQPPFGFLMNWFYNGDNQDAPWKSVQKIDPTRDSKEKVSRCNFLDAAFAAANLLSQVSSSYGNGILSCGGATFDNSRPGTCSSAYWTPEHIIQSQTTYAGYCVTGPYYKAEDTVGWFNSAKCN